MQRILIALLCLLSCVHATDVGQTADLGLGPVPGSGSGGTTTLSGDATGPSTATVVVALQGSPVSSATPQGLLVWSGTQWIPQAVSGDASMASNGVLSVTGIKGTTINNPTAAFNYVLTGVGNGTCQWQGIGGDIAPGGSLGQFTLVNSSSARSDLGLGTTNYPQFAGVTSTGTIYAQTLTATGASALAGVACTSLVDSGSATVNTLAATGASTLAGVTMTSLVDSGALTANTVTSTGAVTGGAGTFAGLTVQDPTTTSKTLTYNLAGASASTALTIASSQTANRTATIPPLAANDTFGMLGTAATWTGAQTLELPFIADSTDATKKIGFTLSGAATATTLTIVSAQTASHTLTIPILTGNDTVATLGAATQTFTGPIIANGLSTSGAAIGNGGSITGTTIGSNSTTGFRSTGVPTTAQGTTGGVNLYRVNGTLQPNGSLILQSDVGQSTSDIAGYVGNTPTLAFVANSSEFALNTGLADANNITASFSTGGSATVAAGVLTEINTNTTTIASYYLWLPAAPNNGQIVDFVSEGAISAITVSGNGHTIVGAPTAITQYSTIRFIYNTAATTWYREQ